jgi:hypothetical protein
MKHPLEPRHLGVPSGAFKMISVPTVCVAQTVHLSCTDTNTIFKCTKTRFHMTHMTLEFHRVRPNQFLGLWYVRHKPCAYLASRLALVPRHLGVPSGASKTIYELVEHLAQTMHLSCKNTNTISKWTKTRFHMTHVTLEFHRVRPK